MTLSAEQASFQGRHAVSRETIQRLIQYEELIKRWNKAINLVANTTIAEIWTRHFADSAEVFRLAGDGYQRWLDIGSGGGFPGVVVAILAAESASNSSVTCVESDVRKCEFVRTVSRTVGVPVGVISRRIEMVPPQNASVISARALAPLTKLLTYVAQHIAEDGVALLHKGENWQAEVDEARKSWRFTLETHQNPTAENSVILKIGDVIRA